ncbi:hypothetical protein LTR64_006916 [Lithohypha guttulata]|uniref:uncharacterized protein n=1 Tax=Lithohypha guttulata TaxID=1690604 RepID=UPI002DDDE792|nr:hypothetical protein LTR51_004527 [Lithohypha guttulata]
MASPEPPVPLKDHCSIIHDNVLYVYSPTAFLTLPLSKNATWSTEENGVSVTGARCVKGGLDGDSNNPALYVVGGATNSSFSDYPGLQRYSIAQKRWEIITPMSAVTANRLYHGATYLNASSALLVYGGSQNNNLGLSTETFLMLMYPPYRVQAYSSIAPAVVNPSLLPFTEDKALLVGGGNGNQAVFAFHPDPGWVNLGVVLPSVLPDPSIAQVNLQALADGTRILQTFYTNETPNRITRNVITNPGFIPAPYGQTIGEPATTSARMVRRQLIQGNYPAYNSTNAPTEQRTGASLASSSNLVAVVGGDANSTVSVFDSTSNSWLDSRALFGDTQSILTASSTSSSTPTSTPTTSQTRAATSAASSTPAAAPSDGSGTNGLAILGGVLGGICGLAAILIITLLWLRSVKRRQALEAKNKQNDPAYPDDKHRHLSPGGQGSNGSTPLSQQAQPMGRSPVPSAIIADRDSLALFGKDGEKSMEPRMQPPSGSKLNPSHGVNNNITFFKSNNKTPLTISKPMMPDLGDYQERPSVDLGKATPAAPVLPPIGGVSQQKADQRKTDEGWAKYFQADKDEKLPQRESGYTVNYEDDPRRSTSRPSTAKGGGTGFWPGTGVPTSNRSNKLPTRDSAGNLLTHATVAAPSPSLVVGHQNPQTRDLSVAAPAKAKISSADSISTDHSSDDGYEDEEMDAYSDTRESTYQQNAWNPIGNTWSGPNSRPLRPPSVRIGAAAFPPPTSMSEETTNTSTSGASSIPAFPLPTASIGRADTTDQYHWLTTVDRPPPPAVLKATSGHTRQPSNTVRLQGGPPVQDYFGPPPGTASSQGTFGGRPHDSNDMSWLNLGTPAHVHGGPPPGDPRDPA